MKNKAYLVTLTNKEFRSGRAVKYKIIDVIIKQMAVFRQIRKMDHYFFFPTLEEVRKTSK